MLNHSLTINHFCMRKKPRFFVLLFFMLCHIVASAQNNITVTGKVTGDNSEPLPGVNVSVSGSTQTSTTDSEGLFSINAPSNGSLVFSFVGYASQTVRINGRPSINITLESDAKGLDEVIVTGYSSQKKKDITGSVAIVDVKAMKTVPSSSTLQALQGQAAGVDIINNGAPGGGSSIFIRGITGFNTQPLILVDGVQGADINDIPADNIESIQVLKDAGAASIYGARGANGVIIVTTKKGRSGRFNVDYEAYFNYVVPRKQAYDVLTTEQYVDLYSKLNPASPIFGGGNIPDYLWRNSSISGAWGKASSGAPEVNPALYKFDYRNITNNYIITQLNKTGRTNMYDEIFNPALMMQHNITASGGNDRASYLLSFGYLDQQGTLKNTSLTRYNVRVNTEYKVTKNIRIGENMNVFYKKNLMPEFGSANATFNSINQSMQWLPFLPIYDVGGNFVNSFVAGDGGDTDLGDIGNAMANRTLTDNNRRDFFSVIGNAYIEIDFLKKFRFKSTFGGDVGSYFNRTFNYNFKPGGGISNESTDETGLFYTAQWTNTLTYNNQFGKHGLTALIGSESVASKGKSLAAYGQNYFITDYDYLVLNNAGNVTFKRPTNGFDENSLFSLFAQLNYNYGEKYYIGATIRRDGYSHFGTANRFGVFPAGSIGWRIKQESFMQDVNWINNLMLRASYGEMGNKEGIPAGNSYATYGQSVTRSYYPIGGGNGIVQGFFPLRYGNEETSWERNKVLNIGVDATLFNNHLDLSIEYYEKKMDGWLRQLSPVGTSGEGNPPTVNLGNIQNKGMDFNATYRGQFNKNFSFSAGVNVTAYRNKIIAMPDPGYIDEGQIRYQVGHPISSFYGYKVLGVFRDQEDVDKHATQQDAEPGRYKFWDANGDGTITPDDRVHYGSPNPDFTVGLNLTARYKDFDFSAIFYSVQGVDIYNGAYEYTGNWVRGKTNKSTRVLRAWTPENPDTDVPKNEIIPSFSSFSNNVYHSAFMEDGSFIRLRSLQVGYTVQSGTLKRWGLNKLRLYVQGTNLFLITKYTGADPEVAGGTGFRGVDTGGAYPQDKGFVFGLNVGF